MKPTPQARINFLIIAAVFIYCIVELALNAITIGRVMPGVSVAGHDMSFRSRSEVNKVLSKQKLERQFSVKVGEKVFNATSRDLGANYDLPTTVNTAYETGREPGPMLINVVKTGTSGQIGYAYNVDQLKLKSFAESVVRSVGFSATNATLVAQNGVVNVIPDKDGLRIDQKYLNKILANALADAKDQNLNLEPQPVKADITVDDTQAAKKQAEQFLSRSVVLQYQGRSFSADKVALSHMIVFAEVPGANGEPTLEARISESQVAGYVQAVANQINIAPVNKKVNIRNGTNTVEREGKDGLAVNQQPAIAAIVSGLNSGRNVNFALSSSPVAFKTETNRSTSLDYGSYIEINLSSQRLWAYENNQVIFSTPITSGASGYGFGTPTGLFSIYSKQRSRYLNGGQYGWNYNVFVDYWMPFNGGVGLHDADWRSSFGGQDYIMGGSHGCVNMNKSAAAFLYGWANVGTPVWVHK